MRRSPEGFSPVFTVMLGLASALMLSACVATQQGAGKVSPATTTVGASANNGPEYVEGKGYKFTWTKTDSSLVSAPREVKAAASAICAEQGFDVAYMRSIAFSTDEAMGYFACRGSGGN